VLADAFFRLFALFCEAPPCDGLAADFAVCNFRDRKWLNIALSVVLKVLGG
jgi:hypothetical protein